MIQRSCGLIITRHMPLRGIINLDTLFWICTGIGNFCSLTLEVLPPREKLLRHNDITNRVVKVPIERIFLNLTIDLDKYVSTRLIDD